MTFYTKHNCEPPKEEIYSDDTRWKCDKCGLIWKVNNNPIYCVMNEEDAVHPERWVEVPRTVSGWTTEYPMGSRPEYLIKANYVSEDIV